VEKGEEMIGFMLTEEQQALQKMARDFAAAEMKPYARELDRRQDLCFDWGIVERFAKAGVTGLAVPREYGGSGADSLTMALVMEELATACTGMTTVLAGTLLAACCLRVAGSEEQKRRYLPILADPKGKLGCMAITEAGAGSDLASIATRARLDADGYLLSGTKSFITNAGLAAFYIIVATTDPAKKHSGLQCFVVPGDASGLSLGKKDDKMGLRASQTGEIILNEVRVPRHDLVGRPGTGFLVTMQTLDTTRPWVATLAVGVARTAYETALDYAKKRVQFGHPIFANQAVSFALADMATSIDAARLLVWRACSLIDSGGEFTRAGSMAKLFATEMAEKVCSQAMHLLGASGYSRECLAEKHLRDAKALTTVEGTSEIQRRLIAAEL
jgi:alkylation response protein AidB-like acyl-CoA dehydrogenase